MATDRPDSDPAEGTTTLSQSKSTTSAAASKAVVTAGPSSSSVGTFTTSGQNTASSSSTSIQSVISTSANSTVLSSTASQSIEWGPAITASPLPGSETQSSMSNTTAALTPHSRLFKGQRQATIAGATIGGVLLLGLLLYVLYRRQKGATVPRIIRFRPHPPSTVILSPTPREARLTALPIYRESRYSVRSSKHASVASLPKVFKRSAVVPPEVSQRFHRQNPYVKNLWKTTHPPSTPSTPLRETHTHSYLDDASPPAPPAKGPEKARMTESRLSSRSRMTMQSSGDTTKSSLAISIKAASSVQVDPASPPESPHSQRSLNHRSWTNPDAPPTPRYAPSLRSSISSLPRFRRITSWVRGQTERIDEERPAVPPPLKKKPSLKNKALKPTLAPPITRRLSKAEHRRIGSLSSIFNVKQHPGTRINLVPTPIAPVLQEQRPGTAPRIEMMQQTPWLGVAGSSQGGSLGLGTDERDYISQKMNMGEID